ncbi:MAG: response regulator [Bacteroidales bacterium]|nr:response regulator [Bacteroidales bacterium]
MKKVLVVDDNIIDRKLISQRISNEFPQVSVKEATDGLHALKMLEEHDFDLIITDLVMPKMEGIELIQHINSLNSMVPIIAVSGHNPYYLYLAKKMGVRKVFTKPLHPQQFIREISLYLGLNERIVA